MPERPRDSVKATLSKVAAAEYMTKNRNCPRMAAGSGAASARLAVMSKLTRSGKRGKASGKEGAKHTDGCCRKAYSVSYAEKRQVQQVQA